jgi:DNA-binding CsgD family transcriptional regulator
MLPRRRPIRLAIVSDFELVVAGVEGMLSAHRDRVVVIELPGEASRPTGVDIVLWDSSARPVGEGLVDVCTSAGQGATLIAFDWAGDPAPDDPAGTPDVACHLSKGLTGLELVQALEAVRDHQVMGDRDRGRDDASRSGRWPGVEEGLTRREAQMLDLIARGLSNQEIAETAFLSINSVKTHIRTAYRKLGVTRRSQAVGWGIRHGMASGDPRDRRTTVATPAKAPRGPSLRLR